jgi:hypothetical protein
MVTDAGGGLNVEYCFTREDSFYGAAMNTIKLVLHNTTNLPLTNIRVGELRLETAMQLQVRALTLYARCITCVDVLFTLCSPCIQALRLYCGMKAVLRD